MHGKAAGRRFEMLDTFDAFYLLELLVSIILKVETIKHTFWNWKECDWLHAQTM
jgi:hypothetical protein